MAVPKGSLTQFDTGFDWYRNPPAGFEVKRVFQPADRRSFSLYVHSIPSTTGIVFDHSLDPVISLALNPEGEVSRRTHGVWERARPRYGTVTLTPAQEEFPWSWNGRPVDILDVCVPRDILNEAAHRTGQSCRKSVNLKSRLTVEDAALSHLIHSILFTLASAAELPGLLVEAMTLHLASSLVSNTDFISTESRNGSELSSRTFKRVLEYIDNNLEDDMSIEELAKVAGISRFHFSRLFRNRAGLPPYQYVQERRLERAMVMLKELDLPISEISRSCGFNDPSYFSKRFARKYGRPPTRYR